MDRKFWLWLRELLVAMLFVASFIAAGCSGNPPSTGQSLPITKPKPPSLAKPDLFPAQYQGAVRDVADYLTKRGDVPGEFYAKIVEEDKILIFHLWHESAFLPENENMKGNPGGKCFSVWYDPEKRVIVKTGKWQ